MGLGLRVVRSGGLRGSDSAHHSGDVHDQETRIWFRVNDGMGKGSCLGLAQFGPQ